MTTAISRARYSRLTINRIGLWLFIISEFAIFVALLAVRFYLEGTSRPEALNQTLGLAITSILLISSLTAYRAETAIAHGDQAGFIRNTLATLILGLIFLVGVGIEWTQAFREFPPQSGFGRVFFAMTGMHAFHVLTGLILFGLLYFNGRRGTYSAENHWGAEAIIKYWHFVDVVWVFFYPALYLLS